MDWNKETQKHLTSYGGNVTAAVDLMAGWFPWADRQKIRALVLFIVAAAVDKMRAQAAERMAERPADRAFEPLGSGLWPGWAAIAGVGGRAPDPGEPE